MNSFMNLPKLSSLGTDLDTSPDKFGPLRSSQDVVEDDVALRSRMDEDGYLYLPGYLNLNDVLETRREMTSRLASGGHLAPGSNPMDAFACNDSNLAFVPDLALHNTAMDRLLYSGKMMDLYSRLLDGVVRHYDFTWVRAVSPNKSTAPHCDIVYMGRGTDRLYTAWTPIGDIDLKMGGLIILENSHKYDPIKKVYGTKDVDSWCSNKLTEPPNGLGNGGNIGRGGWLSKNPYLLRERIGGRWLTADFQAGDLLTFGMYTVHASLDNRTDRIRLSTDSRYQLASDPIDERWIGENPIGHGPGAKRAIIC